MTLQQGAILQGGKYIIKRVLGQGGFGITYLAENTMLDGKVAIKEFFFKEYCDRDEATSHVTIGTSSNRELVERFKQKFIKEARTIFKLNHPNIVRILDIFEENGTAYYVMDYIEGESLGDMVKRRGAIPEAEAVGYIKEVASALSYIHGKSINHLDIKPGNIMKRQEDGQILLIDFGVSKQYDAETAEGTTTTPVGISHGYSPVEQYKKNGVSSFSPQSDIYSLGATLYKLITGDTLPEAIKVAQMDGILPVDASISGNIKNAITKALQFRKEDRPQTVSDFLSIIAGNCANLYSFNQTIEDDETTQIVGQKESDAVHAKSENIKKEPQLKTIEQDKWNEKFAKTLKEKGYTWIFIPGSKTYFISAKFKYRFMCYIIMLIIAIIWIFNFKFLVGVPNEFLKSLGIDERITTLVALLYIVPVFASPFYILHFLFKKRLSKLFFDYEDIHSCKISRNHFVYEEKVP